MWRMVCKHCGFLRSSIEQFRQAILCNHEYEPKSITMDETIELVKKAKEQHGCYLDDD